MESIILSGKKFNYLILRKQISSIRLRIKSRHSFTISSPFFTPKIFINGFIKKNQDWIVQHAAKISHPKNIKNLKKLNILGQDYQLIFVKTQKDSVVVFQKDQKIFINISLFTNKHIKKIFESKLRPFALSLIKKELVHLSQQFGFKYNHVTVRNQSSRFGSCSSHGNLNFNWQIIFFPVDKFRHILLHELTHLKIKNHSKVFWDQLSIYDSHYKSNNLWLKHQGTKHFLF